MMFLVKKLSSVKVQLKQDFCSIQSAARRTQVCKRTCSKIWEGYDEFGKIFTFLLATQVCFAR